MQSQNYFSFSNWIPDDLGFSGRSTALVYELLIKYQSNYNLVIRLGCSFKNITIGCLNRPQRPTFSKTDKHWFTWTDCFESYKLTATGCICLPHMFATSQLLKRQSIFISNQFHTQAITNAFGASFCYKQPPFHVIWNLNLNNTTARVMHCSDVTMSTMASQTTSVSIVYSTVYSDADQRKHQSSASLAFVRGTGEFPAQMASNVENVSIWWRHHVLVK